MFQSGAAAVCACASFSWSALYVGCGARALLLLIFVSWARARLPRDAKAAAAAFLILRPPQRRAAHPRRRNPLMVTISNWKFISPRAVCSTYKRIISVCFHQMITPESFPRNWDETFSRTLLRWERKEIHIYRVALFVAEVQIMFWKVQTVFNKEEKSQIPRLHTRFH